MTNSLELIMLVLAENTFVMYTCSLDFIMLMWSQGPLCSYFYVYTIHCGMEEKHLYLSLTDFLSQIAYYSVLIYSSPCILLFSSTSTDQI